MLKQLGPLFVQYAEATDYLICACMAIIRDIVVWSSNVLGRYSITSVLSICRQVFDLSTKLDRGVVTRQD